MKISHNIKIEIIFLILGTIAGIITTLYFSEAYSEITLDSNSTIENDTIFIEINNPSFLRDTGTIRIYGIQNRSDLLVGETETIYPLSKRIVPIKMNISYVWLNNNVSGVNLPVGKWFNDNNILYRITCKNCRYELFMWEEKSKFGSMNSMMRARNLNGKYILDASEPFYNWIEIKHKVDSQ